MYEMQLHAMKKLYRLFASENFRKRQYSIRHKGMTGMTEGCISIQYNDVGLLGTTSSPRTT